jgi:hypothetical protein
MNQISRKWWFSTTVTLGLLALVWIVGTVVAQGPDPGRPVAEGPGPRSELSLAATVSSTISYQGVLQESGVPVTGDRDLTFNFYASDRCAGLAVYSTTRNDVALQDGVFSVQLDVTHAIFSGPGVWLQVEVGGVGLGCEAILPVPYALSLRPGATIAGGASGAGFGEAVVNVDNTAPAHAGDYPALYARTATGSALRGESGSIGVYGYSTFQPALYGEAITGTAGYFQSGAGYGIRVNTDGDEHWDHGGYFTSHMGYGVNAESAHNYGVHGFSPVRQGVFGESTNHSGVRGSSDNWVGVSGDSTNDYGVEGATDRSDQNYGLYTADNLYSNNYHLTGAVMQVAQNNGEQALVPGDVVVFTGVVAPQEPGGPLVIQVARASGANSPAVAGVVHRRFNLKAVKEENRQAARTSGRTLDVTLEGPVPPGAHLLLVVQGPARVKASALSGAIQPGDRLSTAAETGAARVAAASAASTAGTVFAKALEPLDAGQDGLIYVYVTLH